MMKQLCRVLVGACAVLGLPALAVAQQPTTITGRVTSEGGIPLASAQVYLEGMSLGGLTQADGSYSITVPADRATGQQATLTARLIGYKQASAPITLSAGHLTHDFQLTVNPVQLQGVVVTGIGGAQKKSQLGTAVQQVTSQQLNTTHAQNVEDQLGGKVAGVQVSSSGTQGGSTHIVIRGANSINGNNEPLYIVDGIAVDNSNILGGSNDRGGHDFGSPISDLNADDIASITVLKGPNAAALYGSRAANGVVLITTKHGSATGGKIQTQFNTSQTWDSPSILPDYQNMYGQGSGGQFKYVDGAGSGIFDFWDASYGPKLDGRLIDQFTGPQQPWVAHPDNVKNFFNTGRTSISTIAFSGGTDQASARASLGYSNVDGYIPNSTFRKLSGSLSGSLNLGSHLSTNANVQYITNRSRNNPGVGYNSGILEQFIWFGRQVDMAALKAKQYNADGSLFNWNSNYHNNPYWLQYDNMINQNRDNVIASGSAKYKFNDWLDASLLAGLNNWNTDVNEDFAKGNLVYSDQSYAGALHLYNMANTEQNTQLLLNANKDVTTRLNLTATAGAAHRYARYTETDQTTDGLSVAGIYNLSNAAITPTLTQRFQQRGINSVFGSASFTWDNWWTVEGTARNDWSSTLPKGSNSYFYPSANTSIVVTNLFPSLKNSVLSYLKLRGGLARVGADADPYQLLTTYNGLSSKFGSNPQYTLSNTIANSDLKPEITTSSEVGAEMEFFNGRASVDMSYYDKRTKNQIINLTVAPSSGFGTKAINAGEIENKGFEAQITATPLQLANGFQWTTSFNYAHNKGKVNSLYPGLTRYLIYSDWGAQLEARVGQPYGDIYGYKVLTDSATGLPLTSGGVLQGTSQRYVLGNVYPDWTGGWSNDFHYKGASLSFLFDIHEGGDIFSVSNMFGDETGIFTRDLKGREIDWNNPGITVNGIDADTKQKNTTNVTTEDYWNATFEIHSLYVYDDSWIKLREVTLGYDLPEKWANFLHASSANIAVVGRNLWTHTHVPNIDPEFSYQTGNVQGFEFAALPNPRSLGFNLRITP
ncbi:MAG TPA: SusC/RagA family TonB-linked outer membrane protein [Gemmatimonadaceae bacterium]